MFDLTKDQWRRLQEWSSAQNDKVAKMQDDASCDFPCTPYYGAIGGHLTYSFTPTSIGTIVVVENNVTKEKIDLTDYDLW
jgi:hypothetical protein